MKGDLLLKSLPTPGWARALTALLATIVFTAPPALATLPLFQLEGGDGPEVEAEFFLHEDGGRARPQTDENDPRNAFDVLHYDLDLTVDPDRQTLEGEVGIDLRILQPTDHIVLDLFPSLEIVDVSADTFVVTGRDRIDDRRIRIDLNEFLLEDTALRLVVRYRGTPGPTFFADWMVWDEHGRDDEAFPVVATISTPDRAGQWWPCKDLPSDKATGGLTVTAPSEFLVASNGVEIGRTDNGNGTATTRWATAYPMATYNFSLAMSNYETWTDTYVSETTGLEFPIRNFVYPEDVEDARIDLPAALEAMALFERIFGPYPFANPDIGIEKYGHAEVNWSGAMEHQTMTSLGNAFFRGTGTTAWAIAHELAHQWFGNCVTPSDFDDIWLNEGLATYCEALFEESRGGLPAYHNWLRTRRFSNFLSGPIVDPTATFGPTVYWKGAWTLHGLRWVLRQELGVEQGDETLLRILREYAQGGNRRYGNSSTSEFIFLAETLSAMDLRWYFGPWLYGEGRPYIRWDWARASGDGRTIQLTLDQTPVPLVYPNGKPFPTSPNFYPMPWEVRLYSADGDSASVIVRQTAAQMETTLRADFAVETVIIDPDRWFLRDLERGSGVPAGEILGSPVRTVPGSARFSYRVDSIGQSVNLDLFDVQGRRIRELVSRDDRVGLHWVQWNGDDSGGRTAPAGLYFLRARRTGAGASREETRKVILIR